MIASIKKVFLKAPPRIQIFIETEPNLPLKMLNKLKEEHSVALVAAKNFISKLGIKIKNDLIFISSNYGF